MAVDTRVVVVAPGGARRTYRLTRFPVVVGRDPACDITVVASEEIAPQQIRIEKGPVVVDMAGDGSTLFLGDAVSEQPAKDRDVFNLADMTLEFHISPGRTGTPSTDTVLALEVLSGDLIYQRYRLDREITIGRAPDNTFPARQPDLSGHHAALRIIDGLAVIEDVGSRNGTMVNGEKLTPNMPRSLTPGDLIDLASLGLLVLEDDGSAQIVETGQAAGEADDSSVEPLRTVGNAPVVADDVRQPGPASERQLPTLPPPEPEKRKKETEYEVDLDALRFDDDD